MGSNEQGLSPAQYPILLVLADGDQHGCAIMQRAAETTDGRTRLGAGTLYGAIKRLLDAGLVEESGDRPVSDLDDERRRYYRLTPLGRAAVREHSMHLRKLVEFARRQGVFAVQP